MIGVKITVLLIVLTIVMKFLVKLLIHGEDADTQLRMALGEEIKWYTVAYAVYLMLDAIGIIYSAVYLLFFR
jgi:hypothetical protein